MAAHAFPRWIVLQLTRQCNLNCRMCYEWGERGAYTDQDRRIRLSPDLVRRLVRECAPHRPHFELFGGEPFLYDHIPEVIRWIKASGSTLHIPTNGTLLDRFAGLLVREKVDRVWISMDGPGAVNDLQRGRGSFARALQGLAAVHREKARTGAEKPELGIACVVTPLNYADIGELFLGALDPVMIDRVGLECQNFLTPDRIEAYGRFLADHFHGGSPDCARGFEREADAFSGMDFEAAAGQMEKVRQWCGAEGIRFMSRPGRTDARSLEAYFQGRYHDFADARKRCPLPFVCLEVAADGETTPCHGFYDLSMGNVKEAGIKEIWGGKRMKRLRSLVKQGLLPVCSGCCQYYL